MADVVSVASALIGRVIGVGLRELDGAEHLGAKVWARSILLA